MTLFFNERPLKIVQGFGQYLYDELGTEYLDCINNVAHIGHGNKRVHEAVSKQLAILNTNSRFLHDNLSMYAKRLTSLFPSPLSVCYMVNSGSEANDLAMRLARAYTGRKDIVSVDGAYHGNLSSTMAISPYKNDHIKNFKQPKWAHIAPLPCSYRHEFSDEQIDSTDGDLGQLYVDESMKVIENAKSNGRQVAAFFIESMVSCGGQTPLPSGYLEKLQKKLNEEGTLLVCDEVQTGFGRCGKHMWAFQLGGSSVRPDIVTVGKPMGNGFPVAAVITTPEIASSFKNIGTEYFNTFGGNPVSCAAALAMLDELEGKKLVQQADRIGSYILEELELLRQKCSVVGDVRGYGYFIGIDIVQNKLNKCPAPEFAQFIVNYFRDERILMSTEGKFGNILKFKPPMVFNMTDANRFLGVITRALEELETLIDGQSAMLNP